MNCLFDSVYMVPCEKRYDPQLGDFVFLNNFIFGKIDSSVVHKIEIGTWLKLYDIKNIPTLLKLHLTKTWNNL